MYVYIYIFTYVGLYVYVCVCAACARVPVCMYVCIFNLCFSCVLTTVFLHE